MSSSDHVRLEYSLNAAGAGLSSGPPTDFRLVSSLGITRKLDVDAGGPPSSKSGVPDFLLPIPFNVLKLSVGMLRQKIGSARVRLKVEVGLADGVLLTRMTTSERRN